MNIAVTGAAGEMAATLIPHLVAQGHRVRAIDRATPPNFGDGVDLRVCDLMDFEAAANALEGCDGVVHLAALMTGPESGTPEPVIHRVNVEISYSVLWACARLGIARACLASSVNAIGCLGARVPRYDYFPVDELHPAYPESTYGLSKRASELQADNFARRYEHMRLSSFRFHGLVDAKADMNRHTPAQNVKHLWGYTFKASAARACLLALENAPAGHEVYFIVAPDTTLDTPSDELRRKYYPSVPVHKPIDGRAGFFDCGKAERLLGWRHGS